MGTCSTVVAMTVCAIGSVENFASAISVLASHAHSKNPNITQSARALAKCPYTEWAAALQADFPLASLTDEW